MTSFSQSPYNNDTAQDLVMVKSTKCYMYKTPNPVFINDADTSLLKFPIGLPLYTIGFKDNYFKVNINGEIGYVFCMDVTTPKRIKEIQCKIVFPEMRNCAYTVVTTKDKEIKEVYGAIDELFLILQFWNLFLR